MGECNNLKETEIAWLAGIIDGEGCINLFPGYKEKRRKYYFSPLIQITNTNQDIANKSFEIIQKIIQSENKVHIIHSKRYQHTYKNNITVYSNSIKDCFKLAKTILPYLIGKKRQAEILINFCEERISFNHKFKLNKSNCKCGLFFNEIKHLNKVGVV